MGGVLEIKKNAFNSFDKAENKLKAQHIEKSWINNRCIGYQYTS